MHKIIIAGKKTPFRLLDKSELKGIYVDANSHANGAFTVKLADCVEDSNIQYWIYGHSHYNVDKQIGNTLYVSNQLGYVFNDEHLPFQRDKAIEI
ncbi:hypothetical protein [Bacteroides sp. 224]|uniref:hypothetical protein n=1 Tax=Bacteroides sp. 224 TaxID=2302936 RepID=UPI0013D8AFCA|nr:hypothetical protein [Bacteroides sp. 224]